jgi:hypothetical protein
MILYLLPTYLHKKIDNSRQPYIATTGKSFNVPWQVLFSLFASEFLFF